MQNAIRQKQKQARLQSFLMDMTGVLGHVSMKQSTIIKTINVNSLD
jgi:hypothetical protein